MTHFTTNTYILKREILSFSNKISKRLTRPAFQASFKRDSQEPIESLIMNWCLRQTYSFFIYNLWKL